MTMPSTATRSSSDGDRRLDMNRGHRQLCASARWGRYIRDELVPWVVGERPLGGSVLEIGPGPGLTTDVAAVTHAPADGRRGGREGRGVLAAADGRRQCHGRPR